MVPQDLREEGDERGALLGFRGLELFQGARRAAGLGAGVSGGGLMLSPLSPGSLLPNLPALSTPYWSCLSAHWVSLRGQGRLAGKTSKGGALFFPFLSSLFQKLSLPAPHLSPSSPGMLCLSPC